MKVLYPTTQRSRIITGDHQYLGKMCKDSCSVLDNTSEGHGIVNGKKSRMEI